MALKSLRHSDPAPCSGHQYPLPVDLHVFGSWIWIGFYSSSSRFPFASNPQTSRVYSQERIPQTLCSPIHASFTSISQHISSQDSVLFSFMVSFLWQRPRVARGLKDQRLTAFGSSRSRGAALHFGYFGFWPPETRNPGDIHDWLVLIFQHCHPLFPIFQFSNLRGLALASGC